MNTVTVNASRSYEVKIGSCLLAKLGEEIAAVCAKGTAVIVSDPNVWPQYGQATEESVKRADGTLQLIIPEEIGRCQICSIPMEELKSFLEAGL